MRQSVINYIAQCTICQQIISATTVPTGLLHPLPIPEAVWDDITMDFITALPVSRGMTTILVVVDRLSKYIHLGALPANFTAAKVAELFVEIVVKHHGFPKSIVSDHDPVFVSTFWRRLFELSGTKLSMSSSYHPQTDGQTEVVNRGLEQYLRAFVQDNPKTWLFFLCWAEFHYNSSLKMSPFQALYGRTPPAIPCCTRTSSSVQAIDDILTQRDQLLLTLKSNLQEAQQRMTCKANAHRRDFEFSVGDLVLLCLQPYRQSTVAARHSNKLSKRFYGPFPVLARIGQVVY